MMNSSQDPPLKEYPTLHWVLCSERWEDAVIIAVPELNTVPIENNYLDVSTQEINMSYLWDHTINMESHERNLKE